jgi:hypothetical protein
MKLTRGNSMYNQSNQGTFTNTQALAKTAQPDQIRKSTLLEAVTNQFCNYNDRLSRIVGSLDRLLEKLRSPVTHIEKRLAQLEELI